METSNREQRTKCPHCGFPLERGAQVCSNCGKPAALPTVSPPMPPPVPYLPGDDPMWAAAGEVLSARNTATNQRSVVLALTPRRPATWAFWAGLVMSVGSLVFAICPLLLAMALALDPKSDDPAGLVRGGLLISGCVVAVLLVPGMILVAVGRPRRG